MFNKADFKGKRNHNKNKRNPLAKELQEKKYRQRVIKKGKKDEAFTDRDWDDATGSSTDGVADYGWSTPVGQLMNDWKDKWDPEGSVIDDFELLVKQKIELSKMNAMGYSIKTYARQLINLSVDVLNDNYTMDDVINQAILLMRDFPDAKKA